MHKFICKAQGGSIVPLEPNKVEFLKKLIRSYEELNKKFKITIEIIDKNINESQVSLYKAFIVRASIHFGNTYDEMEQILLRFHPLDLFEKDSLLPVEKWKNEDLNKFIDQANALLLEADNQFKF